MMISAASGFINQSEKYSRDNAGKSLKKYTLLKQGELAYNHGASKLREFGCCFELEEQEARIPYVYHSFAVKAENRSYIAMLLNNPIIDRQLKRLVSSSVRMDGLLNISFDEYMSVILQIPSIKEQTHIVNFFNLLNERIKKQQQLIDSLKLYKRGVFSLLRKTYLSNVKEKKLSDIAICLDNQRIPMNAQERMQKQGCYPYYGANGVQDYVNNYIYDGEFVLLAEDGGHFEDFIEYSIAQFANGKIWVNNHAHILEAKGCISKYLFYMLEHKDIRSYINGTSRAKLNQDDMFQIAIPIPSLKTQQKIVEILDGLSSMIFSCEHRLSSLSILKRGLLQQMFI